jgi:PleD family two-component response regulator
MPLLLRHLAARDADTALYTAKRLGQNRVVAAARAAEAA